MHRIGTVILGLSVGIICWVTALIATAQDAKEVEGFLNVPIGAIVLNPPEAVDATKNPVEFPHSRHFVSHCQECHHKWNFDAELKTCTTSGCHDLTKAPLKENASAPDAAIKFYKNAFHQQCIGCHQEIKKLNAAKEKSLRLSDKNLSLQKSGPTGCVECHPRD